MTRKTTCFFFMILAWFFVGGLCVSAAAPVYETRALWAPESDIMSQNKIDSLVASAAAGHFNTLLPCVFCHGNVYFKNRFHEMNPALPAGFDPLAYLLKKAHAAGLEVHPWFCVTYIGVAGAEGGGALLRAHPDFGALAHGGKDWSMPDPGMVYANVHNRNYRDFIVGLMTEMVRDYPVDGIHYDYIRAGADSHDADSEKEFSKRFGHPLSEATYDDWAAWNSPAVDDIVQHAAEGARAARPDTIISAAVFTNVPYILRQGQNAAKWVSEAWVNVVFTMDYEIGTGMVRINEMHFSAKVGKTAHGAGLSLYQEDKDRKVKSRSPGLVLEQVQAVRKLGLRHLAFFASVYLDDAIRNALAGGPFKQEAKPYFRETH